MFLMIHIDFLVFTSKFLSVSYFFWLLRLNASTTQNILNKNGEQKPLCMYDHTDVYFVMYVCM